MCIQYYNLLIVTLKLVDNDFQYHNIGQTVRDDIAKNAQKATYFVVVADETKDVSRKEQLN